MPLIVFHLSLVALFLLIALGRMTYLKGTLELTEGSMFEGRLTSVDAGPFHFGDLDKVRFVNQGFSIAYAPGLRREDTINPVRWLDQNGNWRERQIGDQDALVVHGYRFYTSHNKGFAVLLRITSSADGSERLAAIHLPSYPLNEFSQANELILPEQNRKLWMMLDLDKPLLDPDQRSEFRLPENPALVIRDGEARHSLRPGDSMQVGQSRIQFEGLRSWMGYNVFYDWTLPWLAATSTLAVLGLCWHFWQKFSRRAWDS